MFKKYSFLFLAMPLVGAVAGPLAYFKLVNPDKAPTAATAGATPAAGGTSGTAIQDGATPAGAELTPAARPFHAPT